MIVITKYVLNASIKFMRVKLVNVKNVIQKLIQDW